MRGQSENRFVKRYLLRRGDRRFDRTVYSDNIGVEYDYKWVASASSFFNLLFGCLKNGFPVAVSKLWYPAWAFYPFFFVRKKLDASVEGTIAVLNHERIHVRQQRDLHILFSLPLFCVSFVCELFGWFNPLYFLVFVPFVPTFFYFIEMVRVCIVMRRNGRKITFSTVRENTCFERESISRATNADYLFERKFMAVLAYTGWKRFQKYGIK